MKKTANLLAALCLAAAAVLPATAHALPAVQRSAAGDLSALPAVQSGWFMALLAQLQALLGA